MTGECSEYGLAIPAKTSVPPMSGRLTERYLKPIASKTITKRNFQTWDLNGILFSD